MYRCNTVCVYLWDYTNTYLMRWANYAPYSDPDPIISMKEAGTSFFNSADQSDVLVFDRNFPLWPQRFLNRVKFQLAPSPIIVKLYTASRNIASWTHAIAKLTTLSGIVRLYYVKIWCEVSPDELQFSEHFAVHPALKRCHVMRKRHGRTSLSQELDYFFLIPYDLPLNFNFIKYENPLLFWSHSAFCSIFFFNMLDIQLVCRAIFAPGALWWRDMNACNDAAEGNCKIPRCLIASNALELREYIASAMKKCIKKFVNNWHTYKWLCKTYPAYSLSNSVCFPPSQFP